MIIISATTAKHLAMLYAWGGIYVFSLIASSLAIIWLLFRLEAIEEEKKELELCKNLRKNKL